MGSRLRGNDGAEPRPSNGANRHLRAEWRVGRMNRAGDDTINAMSATDEIRNIADLARILKEQPRWADTIRGILLGEELPELPARFARPPLENRMSNADEAAFSKFKMERMENRLANFDESMYERRVRAKAIGRAMSQLGLDNPALSLTQYGLIAPELNNAISQAVSKGAISMWQWEDLYEADFIISGEGNRHVVVEVSITAREIDVARAKRRADALSAATGGGVTPAVITADLNNAQREQASAEDVAVFVMPYP